MGHLGVLCALCHGMNNTSRGQFVYSSSNPTMMLDGTGSNGNDDADTDTDNDEKRRLCRAPTFSRLPHTLLPLSLF